MLNYKTTKGYEIISLGGSIPNNLEARAIKSVGTRLKGA
jgi:hypothetical protein